MQNTAKNIEYLETKCAHQEQQIAELSAKVNWFEEQHRLNQLKRFGRSSEVSSEQISIFNEAEREADFAVPEPTTEEIIYKRRKSKGKRQEQLEDLPVEVREYRLLPEEQHCPACGEDLHEMSTEIRREIEIVPAQVKVIEHIRHRYSCRRCEREAISTPIVTAKMPRPAFPKSLASAATVAYIMSQKYVEGLPLYRQEKAFERIGVEISRQNMANWIIKGAENWLGPLYEKMREHLLKQEILHADETSLQVLKEPNRAATSKSFRWLYRSGRDGPPVVLYDYRTTRASKHPLGFLTDFTGYLHVDGYPGYNNLPGITLVGCWAHARRKFDEALKALPADSKNAAVAAKEGLAFCNGLFKLESQMLDLSAEERYRMWLEKSRPLVADFYAWLAYQRPRVLPKSSFGGAIGYCFNQREKLEGFLLDGRLELDNNRAERSIKPFVIGRKNWLFANTPKGAKASATVYSIVESAKENGLNPFVYLKHLFETMSNVDITDHSELEKLLPWSGDLPPECRSGKQANMT